MRKLLLVPIAVLCMGTTFYHYNLENSPYNYTDDKSKIPEAATDIVERDTEDLKEQYRFTAAIDEEVTEIPPIEN